MIIIESKRLLRFLTPYSKTVRGKCIMIFIIVVDASDKKLINHEKIHVRQQLEMLFIPMWIAYSWYYLKGILDGMTHRDAYLNVPFEREAYRHEHNLEYLKTRRWFAWRRYIY